MGIGENPDEITNEAFCELMIQKNIGNYGAEFFYEYIEAAFKSSKQISNLKKKR